MLPIDESALRCPATGQALTAGEREFVSADGSRRYPVIDGIPVLVAEDRSVFSSQQVVDQAFVEVGEVGAARRLARRLTPRTVTDDGQSDRFQRFVEEVCLSTGRHVLVVGGGTLGNGAEPLRDPRLNVLSTDVFVGPETAIVCDGHHLPFADATFDGVVIQAVLEHVLDPVRVVAEIHRVLKPGGLVYAETPFMQQVHEGAYDFTRWTESGHRRLFRWFDEVDRGIVGGPGTSLLWALIYFARSFSRDPRRAVLLGKFVTIGFFWIKYADRLVADKPGAVDAASGVYFMGRASDAPIPDAEVLAGYRGANGRLVRASE